MEKTPILISEKGKLAQEKLEKELIDKENIEKQSGSIIEQLMNAVEKTSLIYEYKYGDKIIKIPFRPLYQHEINDMMVKWEYADDLRKKNDPNLKAEMRKLNKEICKILGDICLDSDMKEKFWLEGKHPPGLDQDFFFGVIEKSVELRDNTKFFRRDK